MSDRWGSKSPFYQALDKMQSDAAHDRLIKHFENHPREYMRPKGAKEMKEIPKIVCLTGSTRFKKEYDDMNKLFTMKGEIVLTVGWLTHRGTNEVTAKEKMMLDELHLRKIDLADYVFVIDKDDYIGDSTRNEINYAKAMLKPIRYFSTMGGF